MHAWYIRVVALVIIAGLSIGSSSSVVAIALCLAASLGSFLLWVNERHLRRGTQPRFWLSQAYLRNVIKTDGRHRLSLGSYFEIPEAFVLIAIPSWIATDDPLWARLIMLAAATVFLITTSLLIFNDHVFNPDEMDPPAWHEISGDLPGPDHGVAYLLDRAACRLGTERLACRTRYLVDTSCGRRLPNIRHGPDHEGASRSCSGGIPRGARTGDQRDARRAFHQPSAHRAAGS
jgi:hypothetical protein